MDSGIILIVVLIIIGFAITWSNQGQVNEVESYRSDSEKQREFLSKHDNIIIEYGDDNTGDLCNVDNLWHCYNKYNSSMDFITGDGGFDFSVDFNKQEIMANKLIFCQICFIEKTKLKYILEPKSFIFL